MNPGLLAAGRRLGVPAGQLRSQRLGRGVTHDTRLIFDGDVPVAVLRLAPPDQSVLPGLAPVDEGVLLLALPALGVPGPEVLLSDPDGSQLGRSGLMLRYVAGDNPKDWSELRSLGGERLAEHALDLLLTLHQAPSLSALNGHLRERPPADWISPLKASAAASGEHAESVLCDALDGLAGRLPAQAAPARYTHGDFRPSNLVVRDNRIEAILDWEMANLGDPARDLGIATMQTWGLWWEDQELLQRYREGGGAEINAESLRWWRCLGYAMVVAFLGRRAASGWDGAPTVDRFVAGLDSAFKDWREALC